MVVYKLTLPLTLANIVGIGYFSQQFILILPKSFQLSCPDFSKEKMFFFISIKFHSRFEFLFSVIKIKPWW